MSNGEGLYWAAAGEYVWYYGLPEYDHCYIDDLKAWTLGISFVLFKEQEISFTVLKSIFRTTGTTVDNTVRLYTRLHLMYHIINKKVGWICFHLKLLRGLKQEVVVALGSK